MGVTWVSPTAGIIDEEKECGLSPPYSCDIPGDSIINQQCVATCPDGPVVFSVIASDGSDKPEYTSGELLVGMGNDVGNHVLCSPTGLISGTVGIFTGVLPPGALQSNGSSIPMIFTFTISAVDIYMASAPRTFQILVHHSWSVDRDNFVKNDPDLGQAHLDQLQAEGFCNN